MPDLTFLSNVADIDEGLGDAGIETFRDTPYASVARECGQNSSDARAESPVIVSFDMLEIDASELPMLDNLRKSIQCCLDKAKSLQSEKEIEFFERAKYSISREQISILKISDVNTKGLVGPCQQGTPFHSLLKGKGVSVKDDPTSGGSFGIGKNAAYAVSDIQTVFYSTGYINNETNEIERLCQGKSILVSHTDAGGEKRLATGYWGEDNYQPVTNQDNVPDWLKREEIGTSIYCICFRETDNWVERLAAALIQNFFCAIHRNEMTFLINNSLEINRDTISSLMNRSSISQAAIDNGHGEDFDFSKNLYECLIAVETKEEIIDIPEIGKVSVRILVKEGLPKRVCFIRNGMMITDNLENFGEKYQRFPLYKDFVALIEPVEKTGISLFRKLENPKHDGFSAERISDPVKRDTTSTAMKKLGKSIREVIKTQSLEKPKDSVAIDELSEFFADEVDPDKIQDPNAIEENPENVKYRPKKRRQKLQTGAGTDIGGMEGGGGARNGKGGTTGSKGKGTGSGIGGSGDKAGGHLIHLSQARNIIHDEDARERKLIITPAESGKAIITVYAEGLNTPEKLNIVKSDNYSISSGLLELELIKDIKQNLVIEFSEPYDGPIEVIAKSVMVSEDSNEN